MTDLERARRRLEEVKRKYAGQGEYLRLLIAAWEYHIRVLEGGERA
jgi:hypothetical protein